jgi:colanic acid biosynthesis glycosyl transferase WcaI
VYSVYDIYPDVGVKLGIFKHKALIDVVATMEKFCLNHAEIVRIVSESFRPGLLNMGVPEAKLHLIYDWVDTDLIQVLPRDNRFARDHRLTDKFVVMYAGNIGLSQGFECVITAARLLCDQKDIQFVFVGDGSGREDLVSQVKLQNITNIEFIAFQPRERLPEVLASADVSLIVLRRGIGSDSLPSKTYSIMASGRPILASVDEECETRNFVIRADAGMCVSPEDPASLAKAIMALKQDKSLRERLGSNGRNWAENHHSVQNAAKQFEKLFESAISSSRS